MVSSKTTVFECFRTYGSDSAQEYQFLTCSKIKDFWHRETLWHKNLFEEERRTKGAKAFKEEVLGAWNKSIVESLDGLSKLLVDTHVVGSLEDGKKLIPCIVERRICYSSFIELIFKEEINPSGEVV